MLYMNSKYPILIEDGLAHEQLGLTHRVRIPDGHRPHPTIVMVHGRAGNEDVTWVFEKALPKNWLLISPRAPFSDPLRGFSWHVRGKEEWSTLNNFDPAIAAFDQFIHGLPDVYGVDLENTHFLGFSQGCALLYAYAMAYPERVNCLAALVGFMPDKAEESLKLDHLKDKRIWMGVGRRDDTIPIEQSQRCASLLVQAGAKLDYREYDTGHKLNRSGMQSLKRWWDRILILNTSS